MARFFNILITGGTSTGPYSVYYNSVDSSNYATLVSTSGNATNISYSDLTTGSGVAVSVPDSITSIILYNELCSAELPYIVPTPTPTPTPSSTPTPTPTSSPTPTPTPTPSPTPDCNFDVDIEVVTATPTPTPTPTENCEFNVDIDVVTATPTPTPTPTENCEFDVNIDVVTATPTPTPTPTENCEFNVDIDVVTATPTPTPTPTENCEFNVDIDVVTATPTPTPTPTSSPTPTPTPTENCEFNVDIDVVTATPTPTPTSSPTPTPTDNCEFDVDVDVVTATPTPTPTPTPSPSPTSTPTPTPTSSPTPTPTENCEFNVDIDVVTATPTPTPSPTPTSTPTSTPTPTPTPTENCEFGVDVNIVTATPTPSPSPTPTPTTDCVFEGAIDQPITIDENTEIYIWFDDSGSMNSTLSPLQTMRNTILRDCLVQFYNNDYNLYDANVSVNNFSSKSSGTERTMFMLNTMGSTTGTTKVINLVFQDEASPYNADGSTFNTSTRTAQYDLDLASLRISLDNVPNNSYYRGIVFRVNTGPNSFDGFRQFLVAVRDGSGSYSGTNGLSDKNEITYIENVTAGSTAQYYADQIITALNTLGYSLNLCGAS